MTAPETLFAPAPDPASSTLAPLEEVVVELPLREIDELRITSGVLFLGSYSPKHARYPAGTFLSRIGPSLPLGQFHYYTDPLGVPLAFCNWVWLSAPVLDEVLTTGRDLEPQEFQCGPFPFFYELLAPFGHCIPVVRGLRRMPFFEGRRIPAIRGAVCRDGRTLPRVKYFHF